MKILMLGSGSIKSNFMYRLLSLGKALYWIGHDVTIIAPKADKYNNFVPEDITDINGVRILQPFQFATKRLEVNLLPYLFAAACLVLREKPDVVYVYKPTPISIIGFIAKLRGIPVVLDMDDLGSEVMRIEGHPWYMRKLVSWCEKFASRRADALVMASTFLYEKQAKAFPDKPVLWLPNGVEAGWFGKVFPNKRKHQIVFFGALNRKNIVEPLFDVLPKLAAQYPDVHLLLIGDGKYLSYFKAKAKKLRVTKRVTFTGWLQLDEAYALLTSGDIGYNYMPDELTVRAASNMKVPQYMSRGVVPLVSDMGDLPWMVDGGKAGYIAAPDDVAALETTLVKALSDSSRAEKAGRARSYARKTFNWDTLGSKVDEFLKPLRKRDSRMRRILKSHRTWAAVGLGLLNAVVLTRTDLWHAGPAFVGVYSLVVPGLLLLSFLAKKKIPLPLGVTLSVALSLALLMGLGTAVSMLAPHFGYAIPLRVRTLLPTFDAAVVILLLFSIWRRPVWPFEMPKFSKLDICLACGAALMPVLAVMGATSLNNGGTNAFTMASLGLIAFYVPLLLFLRKRLGVAVIPIALYLMSLSLLLMNSMRGWLVTGHDVLREYHVFQMTSDAGRWDIAAFRDPYNACLSLTVLPTFLQKLLHIDGIYIFKFVFQFIAALPVISIFYLFRRYSTVGVAFLAAFTYISFPPFMVDMAMLNRQSIGYLFFGLLLYILVTNEYVTKRRRIILLILLGAGMVVSHYSTTYVALSLLLIGYFISLALRIVFGRGGSPSKIGSLLRIRKLPNRDAYRAPALLSLPLILVLILMAVLWNGPVTQTAQGITSTFKKISTTFSGPEQPRQKDAGTSKYNLVAGSKPTKDELYGRLVEQGVKVERTPSVESNLFPITLTQMPQYKTTALNEPELPLTSIGTFITKTLPLEMGSFYESAKQSYAKVLQVLLLVGLAAVIVGRNFRRSVVRNLPVEYLALSAAALLLIGFQVLFPNSVNEYGVLRLFQQNMMLLALPIILGFMLLVGVVLRKELWRLLAYAVVLISFFGILSGLVPQVTGGGRAALPLDNSGFYYDAYYTHSEEVAGFKWLQSVAGPKDPLQADRYFTALKLYAYTDMIASGSRVLPETIKRNSFIMLSTTNIKQGYIIEYQDGEIVYYQLPLNFLNDNKDLLYTTGRSAVYR